MSVPPGPRADGAPAVVHSPLRAAAEAYASRRDWPRSIALFEELLRANPSDVDVRVQLSYVESLAGHYRNARRHALEASAQAPRDPAVVQELIARLRTFNEAGAIRDCAARLPPLAQVPIPLLIAFAAQLSYLNVPEQALRYIDEARRGDPDYPPTLLARAQVLTYLGRFADAQADLERCLAVAPGIPKLYWQLAVLGRTPAATGLAARIRQQLQRPGLDPGATAMLAFALHLELDRRGEFAAAWEALMLGCSAKRARVSYDRLESERLVASLMAGHARPAVATPAARIPVFIIGMHRSGTTLLEQMLDRHPDVRGIGELYDFTSAMRYATDHHCRGVIDRVLVERASTADFVEVGERYLAGVAWRLGEERFFTDKLPSNFLNLGYICAALPQAKILHMVRDPIETCFSNLRELFSDANAYSYDLGELAHFHGIYRRLMAHWHQRFPGRILDVEYARLVREPAAELGRVATFCGFEFDPGMLERQSSQRSVATASAVQVRGELRLPDTPKWKHYEEWLQPLMRELDAAPGPLER